jgi:competence protein ComEA
MLRTSAWTPTARHRPAIVLGFAFAIQLGSYGVSRAQELPPGPERALTQKVCSECHAVGYFAGLHKTRQGWQDVMVGMRGLGMIASKDESAQIVSYLTRERGVPLKINQATESDLEAAMELTPAQAKAVIDYRKKAGPFKSIDDVLKVPNISPDRVREQTKNLDFG